MENLHKPSTSIKNWALDDRPREKMITKGAAALSNAELLAILINTGNKENSALELGKNVLQLGHNNLNELGKISIRELQKVKGIGMTKAICIAAALELGRRRHASASLEKQTVISSTDVAEYLRAQLKDYAYEVFAVLFLNKANKINHYEIMSKGGMDATIVDTKIILKKALEESATSIILCHNHPSGSLKPSQADKLITQKVKDAAALLDIKVIDHIIVSEMGYYSFADDGGM